MASASVNSGKIDDAVCVVATDVVTSTRSMVGSATSAVEFVAQLVSTNANHQGAMWDMTASADDSSVDVLAES
jgi:hypothetical protein